MENNTLEKIASVLETKPDSYMGRYISLSDIPVFYELIKKSSYIGEILISVFLINTENHKIYELLAFELSIEIKEFYIGIDRIKFEENSLYSDFIKENFDRKITIGTNNYNLLEDYLNNYLYLLEIMSFDEEKEHDKGLSNARLFFQIY